jgi:pimeloyl-ACP methyl ester carboxylesterase
MNIITYQSAETVATSRPSIHRRRRRLLLFGAGLLISAGVLLAAGATVQTTGEAADMRDLPAPGQLLEVDGRAMHLNCSGSGSPTVLLLSGVMSYSLDWSLVQPAVSASTRVCSYDRAGLGWSEHNPTPRTVDNLTNEFGELIRISGESGPYIVVGHSYGGIIARLFVARHRAHVGALVLVDSVDDEWLERLQPGNAGYDTMLLLSDTLADVDRVGLLRLIGKERSASLFPASMPFHRLPPDVRNQYVTIAARTSFWTEVNREQRAIHDSVSSVKAELGPVGDLPLVVLTAEDATAPQHLAAQQALLALSTNSQQIIAGGSGHFIQIDQPDLVIDAVNSVTNQLQ